MGQYFLDTRYPLILGQTQNLQIYLEEDAVDMKLAGIAETL